MEQVPQKKRIEYIDLMKGVCIIYVVFHHTVFLFGIDIVDKVVFNFFMPLYFFIAGIFFKPLSCFKEFLIHKTNRILIPYFFFSWVPYCALSFLFTTNFTNPLFWLLAPIHTNNGVLWFLKSLFFAQILYYFFDKATRNKSILTHVIILAIITLINYYVCGLYEEYVLSTRRSIIEHAFFTAVMMLPYLYAAHLTKIYGLLQKEWSRKQLGVFLILAIACAFLFAQKNVSLNVARFGDIYPFTYISALSSIGVVIILCKKIKRLPFVSYLGRYSLIVLGTHYAYLTILRKIYDFPEYINFIILLVLMPPTIWLFKTIFPYFTAQKDLIKYRPKDVVEESKSSEK